MMTHQQGLQLHQWRRKPNHLGPGITIHLYIIHYFDVTMQVLFGDFYVPMKCVKSYWLIQVEVWGLDAILDVAYEGALW